MTTALSLVAALLILLALLSRKQRIPLPLKALKTVDQAGQVPEYVIQPKSALERLVAWLGGALGYIVALGLGALGLWLIGGCV